MLKLRPQAANPEHAPVASRFEKLQQLLLEIEGKDIPAQVQDMIDNEVQIVNEFEGEAKVEFGVLKVAFTNVHAIMNKELGYIKQGFYMNQGLAFGLPFGLLLSLITPLPIYGAPAVGLLMAAMGSLIFERKARKEGKLLLTR